MFANRSVIQGNMLHDITYKFTRQAIDTGYDTEWPRIRIGIENQEIVQIMPYQNLADSPPLGMIVPAVRVPGSVLSTLPRPLDKLTTAIVHEPSNMSTRV